MWYQQLGALDSIFLISIILGGINGYRSGMIVSIFSILGIAFSIFFYAAFSQVASTYIKPWVENKEMLPYLTAVIMFAIITLFSFITGKIVQSLISMSPLGIVDKIFGCIIGSLKWCFFASAILLMLGLANTKFKSKYLNNSYCYKYIEPKMNLLMKKITRGNNKIKKQAKRRQSPKSYLRKNLYYKNKKSA